MGFYIPDLLKQRKIKTIPVWIDGKRIPVDMYSREYRALLTRNRQLRLSFIRENAFNEGTEPMRYYRSGYIAFGDDVCLVNDGLSIVGVIRKEGRKWVI